MNPVPFPALAHQKLAMVVSLVADKMAQNFKHALECTQDRKVLYFVLAEPRFGVPLFGMLAGQGNVQDERNLNLAPAAMKHAIELANSPDVKSSRCLADLLVTDACAIRGRSRIFSASGFGQDLDEAFSLAVATIFGDLTREEACALSGCRGVLSAVLGIPDISPWVAGLPFKRG